jgi:YcaO cyclodehydratase, ATP-ad Mg2+-binding
MLSVAGYRYRNILESEGGPITRISHREFPVYGRPMFQANAWLSDSLVSHKRNFALYSDADGTGASGVPMIARYMAISEAMERWAFRVKVHAADRELYGFDIDESSNGMAAFPDLFQTEARKRALLEAVERSSVIAWWEGVLDGEVRSTDWPGINALVLPSPIGFGVTVVAFREVRDGCFAYGHGAAKDFFGAAERAVMELARNEYVLDLRRVSQGLATTTSPASDLFERRCLFFSSSEGHAMFQERIHRKITGPRFTSEVICDSEIEGPWSEYASVWRVLIKPATTEFLVNSERYFFW